MLGAGLEYRLEVLVCWEVVLLRSRETCCQSSVRRRSRLRQARYDAAGDGEAVGLLDVRLVENDGREPPARTTGIGSERGIRRVGDGVPSG